MSRRLLINAAIIVVTCNTFRRSSIHCDELMAHFPLGPGYGQTTLIKWSSVSLHALLRTYSYLQMTVRQGGVIDQ